MECYICCHTFDFYQEKFKNVLQNILKCWDFIWYLKEVRLLLVEGLRRSFATPDPFVLTNKMFKPSKII